MWKISPLVFIQFAERLVPRQVSHVVINTVHLILLENINFLKQFIARANVINVFLFSYTSTLLFDSLRRIIFTRTSKSGADAGHVRIFSGAFPFASAIFHVDPATPSPFCSSLPSRFNSPSPRDTPLFHCWIKNHSETASAFLEKLVDETLKNHYGSIGPSLSFLQMFSLAPVNCLEADRQSFHSSKPEKIGRNCTVFLDFADGRSKLWNRAMFSNAVARANSILARCGDTAFYPIVRYRRLLWRREAVSREGELFPAMEPRPVASTIFLCSRRRVDRSVSPTLQEKFLACLPTL